MPDRTGPQLLGDGTAAGLLKDVGGGRLVQAVTAEGVRATYVACTNSLVPAAAATDVVLLVGSASRVVRVSRVSITGVQTTAGIVRVYGFKRSTDDAGGTSSPLVAVPHDSQSAAATAVCRAYTANPTAGTDVGIVFARRVLIPAAASLVAVVPEYVEFGTRSAQHVVLRGVAECLALSLMGATVTGGLLDVEVEWTEE